MFPYARLFYLLVAASAPVAFGLLITAIEMFRLMNEISSNVVIAPQDFDNQKSAAFAPTWLGLEASIPLWIAWAIYLLIISSRHKE